MSLEEDVSKLTQATTELIKAVNVQKSYLDAAAKAAIAGVTVQGAIVPTPGKSPVGNANGLFDPAWLDPSLPLASPLSVGAVNKYGYTFMQGGQGQRLFKLATMLGNGLSTYASLRIDAMIGNWLGSELTAMTIVLGSRNDATGLSVDWNTTRFVASNVRFVAYKEANGEISVYLFFLAGSYAQASLQMMGMQTVTYAAPAAVSSVTGTLIWDSSVGPEVSSAYRSPRSRGTGPASVPGVLNGTSFDSLVEVRAQDGITSSVSYLAGAPKADSMAAKQEAEALRIGVSGNTGISYAGFFQGLVSVAENNSPFALGYKLSFKARDVGSGNFTPTLFSITGNGQVYMPVIKVGTNDTSAINVIAVAGVEGTDILTIVDATGYRKCNGEWGNLTNAAQIVKANSVTGRSSNNRGTVNTMGNDYAEYIFKSPSCGNVAPGQIVGISADNKITDQWAGTVLFSIKSTAPSFVGGDSWADNVGRRPDPLAGAAPIQPMRRETTTAQQPVPGTNPPEYEDVVTEAGDSDDEWAAKQAVYADTLAAYTAAVQQDADAMAAFDALLEAEREKVDRIAIAGRVPVNVLDAQPGDYIVPVQDGAGIKGIPVHEDNLTMKQYLSAVGRVISIEPDGRAYVMVKVV